MKNVRNHACKLWACLLGGLMCYPVSLLGQERGDTITGRVHDIPDVVVTGNRAGKPTGSSSPLQLIDGQQMQQQGITDLADALRRFSGVNVRDYGGAGGMKTVSVRSLGAKHTAVVYDGINVSDCQSGQIDLSRFSLDNIKQISLTIGDNEDIFVPARTAASAATLRLQSATPDFTGRNNHLTGQVRMGSFGLLSPLVRYEQKLSEKVAITALGEFMRADNLYSYTLVNGKLTTREKRYNNNIETYRGELNLFAKPNDHSLLMGKVYYYENNQKLPGAVILYNTASATEKLHDKNFFSQLHYRTYWNNNLSLQLNGKFNWSMSHYHDEGGKYSGDVLNEFYYQREYYASGTLLYTPNRHWSMVYAADYSFNNLSSNLSTDVRPYRHTILQTATLRYQNSRLTAVALLLGSLYLNDAKDGSGADNNKRLSPSISLSWRPFEEHQLYLRTSYKDIFRVASFSENYFDRLGSSELKPEKAKQFNVGVTYQNSPCPWLTNLTLSVDGYYNRVEDKIVAMPYNMFIWTMVNIGKVDIWGLDANLSANFKLADKYALVLNGNYTYQYAVDVTSKSVSHYKDQIAYTPRHSGGASLAFENPLVNLSIHATGVSERYVLYENTDANRMGGYMEYGVALYRRFKWKRLSFNVRGDIINLGDKQYDIVKRYPMPGRSYKLTCNINF